MALSIQLGFSFNRIVHHYIEKKDYWYLVELMCAVYNDVNYEEIMDEVYATGDKQFMNECANYALKIGIIEDKDFDKYRN